MIPQLTCKDRLASIKAEFEKTQASSALLACRALSENMLVLAQDFPERESDINKIFCELVCGAL